MTRLRELYDVLYEEGLVNKQQDFSDAVGISRPVISQLLLGKRPLLEKHVRKICRAYPFVNKDWLLTGNGAMITGALVTNNTEEKDLQGNVLPEEDVAKIKDLEHRAALYEKKALEVKQLYDQLSDSYRVLSEKEEEISKLQAAIREKDSTISTLRQQIAHQ